MIVTGNLHYRSTTAKRSVDRRALRSGGVSTSAASERQARRATQGWRAVQGQQSDHAWTTRCRLDWRGWPQPRAPGQLLAGVASAQSARRRAHGRADYPQWRAQHQARSARIVVLVAGRTSAAAGRTGRTVSAPFRPGTWLSLRQTGFAVGRAAGADRRANGTLD